MMIVMSVGWIIVSVFTFIIAAAMAEIVSAIPTAGGTHSDAEVTTDY